MNLSTEKSTKTTVAMINKNQIAVIDQNGMPMVPIKPICEALGIAHRSQVKKLKEDVFYNSTITLGVTVGADGKQREMVSLPLKYTLLWLGSINPENVAPEARESVLNYKEACADALYNYLYGYVRYSRERNARIFELKESKKEARQRFNTAKDDIKMIEAEEMEIISTTYDDYLQQNQQIKMDFPAEIEEAETV